MGPEVGDVTVITVTIPGREEMLKVATASVERQNVRAAYHAVGCVLPPEGPARMRSGLVSLAGTEWVAFLDDDDMLYPHHLETLLNAAQDDGGVEPHGKYPDVVIPYCDFIGPPLPDGYYNRPFDRQALRRHGIFPITVLARRSAVLKYGGFRTEDRYEDWALWNRMARGGCRFVTVPEITWTYRRGHESRTGGLNL